MNRLQKKCFIASTGLHLFMAGILFVGPAFLSSPESKSEDVPIINFIPLITTDQNISGGGSPTGRTPTSAQPPQPEPLPEPLPEPPPEPTPEPPPTDPTPPPPPAQSSWATGRREIS